jgi:hypothetical protein
MTHRHDGAVSVGICYVKILPATAGSQVLFGTDIQRWAYGLEENPGTSGYWTRVCHITRRIAYRWTVSENRVFGTIFGPKRGEISGDWRKLIDELRNFVKARGHLTTVNCSRVDIIVHVDGWDISELRPPTGLLFILTWSMKSHGGMTLTGENWISRWKIRPIATLFNTNPTCTDPGANWGLRCEKPATNRLSHGTAGNIEGAKMWTGFNWLITESSGGLLWTW